MYLLYWQAGGLGESMGCIWEHCWKEVGTGGGIDPD